MENIPFYVYAVFGLALLLTLYLFYRATQKSKGFIILLSAWLFVQSITGILGFYKVTNAMPPRFLVLVLPPLVLIVFQFSTKKGRAFIESLDLKALTLVHTVRLPVEMVLYWLFIAKQVPQLMTFEGRNFDIFSGITAPILYYFGFVKTRLNKSVLLIWNIVCMGLLLAIVINGMLSAPTPLQQFGFEQPNIAVLQFPFLFLPACIVPIVLYAHLSSIRKLILTKT